MMTCERSDLLDSVYAAHDEFGLRADLLGKDASIDFTLQALEYAGADEEARAQVMGLFIPDVADAVNAQQPYVRAALDYAAQVHAIAADTATAHRFTSSVLAPVARIPVGLLPRMLLAWVCNCYSARAGGGALYRYGSLVNHECEGNTRYRYVDTQPNGGGPQGAPDPAATSVGGLQDGRPGVFKDVGGVGGGAPAGAGVEGQAGAGGGAAAGGGGRGWGVFVAVRSIRPGDVITTCYLGWDEQTLMSTRMRQKLLYRTKLFHCTCERCRSPVDPYRAVRCPACHSGGDSGGGGGSSGSSSGGGSSGSSSGGGAARGVMMPSVPEGLTSGAEHGAGGNDKKRVGEGAAAAGLGFTSGGGGAPEAATGYLCWRQQAAPAESQERAAKQAAEQAAEPWECDSCGRRYTEAAVQEDLRRRARAAGFGALEGDPEQALEEAVHVTGEHLDWDDLNVSLGTMRQLGARCLAVLGPRHWATNRCRYSVLELCTAALNRQEQEAADGSSSASGSGSSTSFSGSGSRHGRSTAAGVGCGGGGKGSEGGALPVQLPGGGLGSSPLGAASGDGKGSGAGAADVDTPTASSLEAAVGTGAPLTPQRAGVSSSDDTAAAAMSPAVATTSLALDPVAVAAEQERLQEEKQEQPEDVQQPEQQPEVQHVNPHLGLEALQRHTLHHHHLHLLAQQEGRQRWAAQPTHGQTHPHHKQQQQLQHLQPDAEDQRQGALPEPQGPTQPAAAAPSAAASSSSIPAASSEPVHASPQEGGTTAQDPLPHPHSQQHPHPQPHLLWQHHHHHDYQDAHHGDVQPWQAQQQQRRQREANHAAQHYLASLLPLAAIRNGGGATAAAGRGRGTDGGAGGSAPGAALAASGNGGGAAPGGAGGAVGVTGVGVGMGVGAVAPSLLASCGGSTVWSVEEVDALITCMCAELRALWQWQQAHTPHDPAITLKAVAGPAATALMDAVKDELCSGGAVSSLALATAEATAARLAQCYAAAPHYDVSGQEAAEADSVLHLCPLIRRALDID